MLHILIFPVTLINTRSHFFPMTPQPSRWTNLIEFLQVELALPKAAIALALKHCEQKVNLLPVVLWQYGLVTTKQLDQIFDWLEAS